MKPTDQMESTCLKTFATLRVFSDLLHPEDISELVGCAPTRMCIKGETVGDRPHERYLTSGWFYSTESSEDSLDCRIHLDAIISLLTVDPKIVGRLRSFGCRVDICVHYTYTQGGPTISPPQMKALSDIEVDVAWDLYRAFWADQTG